MLRYHLFTVIAVALIAFPATAAIDKVCGAQVDAAADQDYRVPTANTAAPLRMYWGRWGSGDERWKRDNGRKGVCHILYVISVEDPEKIVGLYAHSDAGKWPAGANKIEGRIEDGKLVFEILQGTREAATVTYAHEAGDDGEALVGRYTHRWGGFNIRLPRWEAPSVQLDKH